MRLSTENGLEVRGVKLVVVTGWLWGWWLALKRAAAVCFIMGLEVWAGSGPFGLWAYPF